MKLPEEIGRDVLWSGTFFDTSGYARMNRELVLRVANSLKVRIAPEVTKDIGVDSYTQGRLNPYKLTEISEKFIYVRGSLPRQEARSGYRICFSMAETETIHPELIKLLNNNYEEFWTPTEWNKRVFKNSGLRIPIHVMPLGVNPHIFRPQEGVEPPLARLLTTDRAGAQEVPRGFRFIALFVPTLRKGMDFLLPAFEEAFADDAGASLILATTGREKQGPAFIDPQTWAVDKKWKSRIYSVTGKLDETDLSRLYNSCQAYVSASRGEGWNLPLTEAAACGIPVIAPWHSAHQDILSPDTAYLFHPEGFAPLRGAEKLCPWYAGQNFPFFGAASKNQLIEQLRRVKKEYGEAKGRAKELLKKIRGEFTWEHAASRVVERLLSGTKKKPLTEAVRERGEVSVEIPVLFDPPPPKVIYSGVRWNGPMFDGSGYAEATRNYIAALDTVGVEVTAESTSFEPHRADYGSAGSICNSLVDRKIDYGFKIIMLTPNLFPLYTEAEKYNIGFFFWETDALPELWVECCNKMDEIWVPCRWTADVARSSGVTRPIHVFGCCASAEDYVAKEPYRLAGVDPDWYKFYSIFQWTERKNPRAMLDAYLTAFSEADPVVLILKTYRSNYTKEEQEIVKGFVRTAQEENKSRAKVVVIPHMLGRKEILGLHQLGDCFVLAQRAEGWGLPHFEACMAGKPVITTNNGGNLEFTKPSNSFLADSEWIPVEGMGHIPWYEKRMKWGNPSVGQIRYFMKYVYANRAAAAARGEAARSLVMEKFSWRSIGRAMRSRLTEICKQMESRT